jgi:hypothetical protein
LQQNQLWRQQQQQRLNELLQQQLNVLIGQQNSQLALPLQIQQIELNELISQQNSQQVLPRQTHHFQLNELSDQHKSQSTQFRVSQNKELQKSVFRSSPRPSNRSVKMSLTMVPESEFNLSIMTDDKSVIFWGLSNPLSFTISHTH